MAASNDTDTNTNSTSTSPPPNQKLFFQQSTELADLGRERFDKDTAAMGDRDVALFTQYPVAVRSGRIPKGLENQAFAWNTFQYVDEQRDSREELKGDLHGGQLHRQNRAARVGPLPEPVVSGRGKKGRAGAGLGGGNGGGNVEAEVLCAGRKPEGKAPPLAKGFAEEMDKSMFWDEPIL